MPCIAEIVILNCGPEDATLGPTIGNSIDNSAVGLISKNSRDNRTAIELFLGGIRKGEDGFVAVG